MDTTQGDQISSSILEQVNDTLNDTAGNGTAKAQASTEGMVVAYGGLFLMALFPIFYGSFRSVKHHKQIKESGETPEIMTGKDVALFPLIASGTLLAIYIMFQLFSKEYINLLLTVYFFFLGILALTHTVSGPFRALVPAGLPNISYHLIFTQGENSEREEVVNYKFDRKDLLCLLFCSLIGVWYLLKKHWIANNLLGLAFAVNGVELLQLNTVMNGCILLCGLFFYDIFWVFGTDVMVTVARSFEAPIKLVFPQDLLEKGLLEANHFAMLGLGDIVIPGIFIAILLRFDYSLHKKGSKTGSYTYFYASFVAYILGLMTTIFVMHVFKHAQPALLYLVPACLIAPLLVACIKGELKPMFRYVDNPEPEPEAIKPEETNEESTKKEK